MKNPFKVLKSEAGPMATALIVLGGGAAISVAVESQSPPPPSTVIKVSANDCAGMDAYRSEKWLAQKGIKLVCQPQ